MGIVIAVIILFLGILLYGMLGQSEKTYAYTSTMLITYRPDGTEKLQRFDESGIVFISGKTLTIDGESFVYKSKDRKKIQAKLNYEGSSLKSIHLNLPDGGEKFYYVDKINSMKEFIRK